MLITLAGCVTVNVNLPESAVQKAADDFVNDLYKNQTAVASHDKVKEDAEAVKSSIKKSSKKTKGKVPAAIPEKQSPSIPSTWRIDFIGYAFASELNMQTPNSDQIRSGMGSRLAQLDRMKEKGAVCETEDGQLRITGALSKDESTVVTTENAERQRLYKEVYAANERQVRSREDIVRVFAAAFKRKSSAKAICPN